MALIMADFNWREWVMRKKGKSFILLFLVVCMMVGCSKKTIEDTYTKKAESTTAWARPDEIALNIHQFQKIDKNVKLYDFGDTAEFRDLFKVQIEDVLMGENMSDIYKIENNKELADSFINNMDKQFNRSKYFIKSDGTLQDFYGIESQWVFVKLQIEYTGTVAKQWDLHYFTLVNMKQDENKMEYSKISYFDGFMQDNTPNFEYQKETFHTFQPGDTLSMVIGFPIEKVTINKLTYHVDGGGNSPSTYTIRSLDKTDKSPLNNVYLYTDFDYNTQIMDGDCFMKLNIIDGQIKK